MAAAQSVWTRDVSARQARAVGRTLRAAGYAISNAQVREMGCALNIGEYLEPGDVKAREEVYEIICEAAGFQPQDERSEPMIITIEMLAAQIAARCFSAYDDNDTLALARAINKGEGWTIETNGGGPGNWLRAEEVRVDDATLVKAHQYAVEHWQDLI